jgi:hypothetical protein
MPDTALFVGFGTPPRGRERKALAVFNEALQFYAELQQRGEIESFEAALLEPHGGDLGGFILLRGERDKLARVRMSDEFNRLTARAGLVVDGFGVVEAALGERLQSQMALYIDQLSELT